MSSAPNLLRVLIALRTFSYEIEPESSNLKSLSRAVTPDTKLFFGEDLRLGCWGDDTDLGLAPRLGTGRREHRRSSVRNILTDL
jgi:hypothetical protein